METYMKKKNKTRSVTGLLFGFMERVSGDHVGAYATQAAYFLIMSFIPCILFLTTLVRYTPLTYNVVRDAIVAFIPENLQSFVLGIVVDVYKRSTAIVPLSVKYYHPDYSYCGTVVCRKRNAVYHQWIKYHLSRKRNP